jgi:aliphatic nitrilase
VQVSPVLYGREATTEKIVQKTAELGRKGVQFATFPETILPYYPYFSFVLRSFEAIGQNLVLFEQSVTVPSPTTVAIGEACRRANIVVSNGINERDGGAL